MDERRSVLHSSNDPPRSGLSRGSKVPEYWRAPDKFGIRESSMLVHACNGKGRVLGGFHSRDLTTNIGIIGDSDLFHVVVDCCACVGFFKN